MDFDFEGKADAEKILELLKDPANEWIGKNEDGLFVTMSKVEMKKYKIGFYNELAKRLGHPGKVIKITHRDDFNLENVRSALQE